VTPLEDEHAPLYASRSAAEQRRRSAARERPDRDRDS
jgi:hypothetical protein